MELCRTDSCAEGTAAGTLPGMRRPSPATARPGRAKVGQVLAAGPGGPWTHRPGAGPRDGGGDTAEATRLAQVRGRNEKPSV